MTGNQVVGWLLILFGFILTLSLIFAIVGIPMMIVGAGMIGGGSANVVQQVNVINQPAPEYTPLGSVRNGHCYRLASDGRAYWYPMTDSEKQAHRIKSLEDDLGI